MVRPTPPELMRMRWGDGAAHGAGADAHVVSDGAARCAEVDAQVIASVRHAAPGPVRRWYARVRPAVTNPLQVLL